MSQKRHLLSAYSFAGWPTLSRFLRRQGGFVFAVESPGRIDITFLTMPWGLKRFQQTGDLHFINFTCHHRASLLGEPQARDIFELTLKRVQSWYGFFIVAWVPHSRDQREWDFLFSLLTN